LPAREPVLPLAGTGYVALFEIVCNERIPIAAIRYPHEDDYD